MVNEDKLFDLMTQMYSEMKEGFNKVDNRLTSLEDGQKNLENRQKNLEDRQINLENQQKNLEDGQKGLENEVRKTNMVIENEIKPNIKALFDGHIQNSEKLDRIEKEVSRQEEIILRKVK